VAGLSKNHRASGQFFKDSRSEWQIFQKFTAPATDFLKMHLASGSFFEKIIAPATDFLKIHVASGRSFK
jgi:hypothetical protein